MSNYDFDDIRETIEAYHKEWQGEEFDYIIALQRFVQEQYAFYFETTADERQMKRLLDKHFGNWQHADWDYDVEWEGTYLSVFFKNLVVDDIPVRDGDPEDIPHPIFKDIASYVDVIQLCVEGVWEVDNHG